MPRSAEHLKGRKSLYGDYSGYRETISLHLHPMTPEMRNDRAQPILPRARSF